jgi:hypothetical protein
MKMKNKWILLLGIILVLMFIGCVSVDSNKNKSSDPITSNVNVEPSVNETLDPIIGSWKSPPLPVGSRYRIFQFNANGSVIITLYSSNGDVIESSNAKWELEGEKYIVTEYDESGNIFSTEEFVFVDNNVIWHSLGRNYTRE